MYVCLCVSVSVHRWVEILSFFLSNRRATHTALDHAVTIRLQTSPGEVLLVLMIEGIKTERAKAYIDIYIHIYIYFSLSPSFSFLFDCFYLCLFLICFVSCLVLHEDFFSLTLLLGWTICTHGSVSFLCLAFIILGSFVFSSSSSCLYVCTVRVCVFHLL